MDKKPFTEQAEAIAHCLSAAVAARVQKLCHLATCHSSNRLQSNTSNVPAKKTRASVSRHAMTSRRSYATCRHPAMQHAKAYVRNSVGTGRSNLELHMILVQQQYHGAILHHLSLTYVRSNHNTTEEKVYINQQLFPKTSCIIQN